MAAQNYTPGGVKVFRADTLALVADIPAHYGADGARSRVVGLADVPGSRFVFSLFDAGEIWIADLANPAQPKIDKLRGVGRQPYDGLITPAEELVQSDAPSPAPSPLEDASWSETERRVLDAIQQLPEMQRATFVLRYREELSVKETAAALGCAEGTVKANGYHAIRRLRKILRKMESPAGELKSDDTSAL